MKRTKENAGITLIALVITIIVLLILAGISIITLTGQNGILTQANKAKQESELAEEKEKAGLVSQELKIEKAQGKDVDKTGFQKMVDSQFGSSKATGDVEDSTYVIVVAKTGNIYLINEDGTIDEAGNKNDMKKDENPGMLEDLGNNTYAVNSIEDLVALSYTVNSGTDTYEGKTVTLGRSLYFNGMFDSYANPESKYEVKNDTEKSRKLGYIPSTTSTTTIKELVTTGEGFMPIGLGESTNCLKGNFDGKNNFIDGIYINSNNSGVGFISTIQSDIKISNFGINSGNINSNNGSTGGIIGLCLGNVVMENCYNKANIQTQGEVGGLIGVSVFNISMMNCYNTGTIKGTTIGGLLGTEASGDVLIEKSYNKGDLIQEQKEGTSQKYMGGIVANNPQRKGKIIESYNSGNIKSQDSIVGGIVGGPFKQIEKCYNTGKIENNKGTMAGIASTFSEDIKDCYNKGEISAGENVTMAAGIATNLMQGAVIENCYNTSSIYGKSLQKIGGIATDGDTVINCYNTGNLESEWNGAIVSGITYGSKVVNCYNTGDIAGGEMAYVYGINYRRNK